MFIDCVKIALRAGKGGNGTVAWRREKYIPKGGPAGGNGGVGGSIYFESDSNIYSLDHFRNQSILLAENGKSGGSNLKQGKTGQDLIIKIPCGTIIRDSTSKQILYDFGREPERVLVCKGGRGGIGNNFFKSATNQAPNKCTPGKEGEEKGVELELKLIADVGFVGFPNAGKSTLLNQLSRVEVKTGHYPFTTLKPNLSFLEFDDYSRIYIADIPGIIKDAHQNKGLGLAFLRHIERSNTLVFLIDVSGDERDQPIEDFNILRHELKEYSSSMLSKPFLVALNKVDVSNAAEHIEAFEKAYPFPLSTLFKISAKTGEGVESFKEALKTIAQRDVINYR